MLGWIWRVLILDPLYGQWEGVDLWTTLSNLEVRGKHISSFAGSRLILGGWGILFESQGVAKTLVFEGNSEFEAIKWISSGPIQKSTSNFWLICVMGSENGWGLGEGTNYQFGRGSKKMGLGIIK